MEPKEYILYKNNPEWIDVKPILQFENGPPIASIPYSEKCLL